MKIKAKGNTGGGTRAHIKGKGRRGVKQSQKRKWVREQRRGG